jgi:hypothetical protein
MFVQSSSISTTICPHGRNNFAAVEWIFITTDYLWLKSDNTNILCMKAYMCFACILNVTHSPSFAGQEMFQTEVWEGGCNAVSLSFVVFEILKKLEHTSKLLRYVYLLEPVLIFYVSIIWHLWIMRYMIQKFYAVQSFWSSLLCVCSQCFIRALFVRGMDYELLEQSRNIRR